VQAKGLRLQIPHRQAKHLPKGAPIQHTSGTQVADCTLAAPPDGLRALQLTLNPIAASHSGATGLQGEWGQRNGHNRFGILSACFRPAFKPKTC